MPPVGPGGPLLPTKTTQPTGSAPASRHSQPQPTGSAPANQPQPTGSAPVNQPQPNGSAPVNKSRPGGPGSPGFPIGKTKRFTY